MSIAPDNQSPAIAPGGGEARPKGLVTVFGGTGFLGRRVVRHLVDRGFRVRVAVRDRES